MSERVIASRYALENKIGDGGMATVWVALDRLLQRRVALKLLQQNRQSRTPARFEQEARMVAQLQDAGVVQVFDYGTDQGEPFVVMELLAGEDLETRLSRVERLPLQAVTTLISQVARGLEVAHLANIVHRDLKPGNLFLARTAQGEQAKILDFGLASVRPLSLAESGEPIPVAGTPQYMSPEQISTPGLVDFRTDLYALGVVVYRALTGQLPFTAATSAGLLWQICNPEVMPPLPSSLVPELTPEVDQFLARALSRDRQGRFQSAREFAANLAALQSGEPLTTTARILVVDDEADVTALLRQRLRAQIRQGIYELTFAADGEEALSVLRRRPDIELVLTDINMPRMDGLTLLEHLAVDHPGVRGIIITAYGDMPNIRAAMNRGALDFLTKPLDLADLEQTLQRSMLQVRRARRAMRSSEENAVLRMFVSSGLVERLVPALRTAAPVAEALEGTVLFIDTRSVSEGGDEPAEQALQRLSARVDAVLLEVTARGGAVDKVVGDQVLALFHGSDHLRRALSAALAIVAQTPLMKVGADSGPFSAGSVGSSAYGRMDYTIFGQVVRSAQTLCGQAAVGQVLVRRELEPYLVRSFSVLPVVDATGTPPSRCQVRPGSRPSVTSFDSTRAVSRRALLALCSDSG